jgi:hypothetical protein
MDATTNYLAFGYRINKAMLEPGDVPRSRTKKYVVGDWYMVDSDYNPNLTREDYLNGRYSYNEISLHVNGKVAITPVHTMTPTYYTKGHCTLDRPYEKGLVKEEVIEPTTVFGIDPFDHLDKDPVLPDVTVLRWSTGDIVEPPVRFFLADGSFKKGEVVYSTTGAYSLSSGNIEILSDCLGFIFN